MLRLIDPSLHGRREFLRVGGLALGGLGMGGMGLDQLLATRSALAQTSANIRDKSVVFLFLHGGPPQTETFDPKMDMPSGIRSVQGEVKTTLSGVTFGAGLPKLARLAHQLSIVRSFTPGDAGHNIKPVVCNDTFGANLGSVVARLTGTNHPTTGMPTNVALFPRAIDEGAQPRVKAFGDFLSTGSLGEAYAPFVPGAGGDLQQDMELQLPRARLGDRRTLLESLDRWRATAEKKAAHGRLNRFQEQALQTILGGVSEAFDLSLEDPRTVERYDTSPLVPPAKIDKRWQNRKNYIDNAKTLGKLLLMARRLCERGCGFVTVTTNFVWDFHADSNNATAKEGMYYCGVPFDHAVSAFLEDLEARGLSEKILLVACGEMGRTPKLNARGGRDHWGRLGPLLLAGGGLNMGQVIGQSTRDAGEPASEPITKKHLIATILHTLFDVGTLRIQRGIPTEIVRAMETDDPIPGLL